MHSRNAEPAKSGSIVVFGQYKSGTTALFSQIHEALRGQEVRTLFEPTEFVAEDGDAERWLLAKVIFRFSDDDMKLESFLSFQKKVFIIRDLRDWIISGLLFSIQECSQVVNDSEIADYVVSLLRTKETDPRSISVVELWRLIIELLKPECSLEWLKQWIAEQTKKATELEQSLPDRFTIRYEDFVDGKLEALEQYLEFGLPKEYSLHPAYAHVPRTKSYGNWRHWFLESDIEHFRPAMEPFLQHYGYPLEWNLDEHPRIEAQFCSEYVARTVAMRQAQRGARSI